MRWATRTGCHIDRAGCAWLIRRFVDPEARFVFVTDPADVPDDATAFDMIGAQLSHHGGDCSFETFLKHYQLEDPVLWGIARIVHEADLADEHYDALRGRGWTSSCGACRWWPTTTRSWSSPGPCSTGCTST